jgi:hypothetical protein
MPSHAKFNATKVVAETPSKEESISYDDVSRLILEDVYSILSMVNFVTVMYEWGQVATAYAKLQAVRMKYTALTELPGSYDFWLVGGVACVTFHASVFWWELHLAFAVIGVLAFSAYFYSLRRVDAYKSRYEERLRATMLRRHTEYLTRLTHAFRSLGARLFFRIVIKLVRASTADRMEALQGQGPAGIEAAIAIVVSMCTILLPESTPISHVLSVRTLLMHMGAGPSMVTKAFANVELGWFARILPTWISTRIFVKEDAHWIQARRAMRGAGSDDESEDSHDDEELEDAEVYSLGPSTRMAAMAAAAAVPLIASGYAVAKLLKPVVKAPIGKPTRAIGRSYEAKDVETSIKKKSGSTDTPLTGDFDEEGGHRGTARVTGKNKVRRHTSHGGSKQQKKASHGADYSPGRAKLNDWYEDEQVIVVNPHNGRKLTCSLDSAEYRWWEDAVQDFACFGGGSVDVSVYSARTGQTATMFDIDDHNDGNYNNDYDEESCDAAFEGMVATSTVNTWVKQTSRVLSVMYVDSNRDVSSIYEAEEDIEGASESVNTVVHFASPVEESLAVDTTSEQLTDRIASVVADESPKAATIRSAKAKKKKKVEKPTPTSSAAVPQQATEGAVEQSFRGIDGVNLARCSIGRISCGGTSTNVLKYRNKFLFEKHVLRGGQDELVVSFKEDGKITEWRYTLDEIRGVNSHGELAILPARGTQGAPIPVSMRYRPTAMPDYLGPVSIVSCSEDHDIMVSAGVMGPTGYDAKTDDGWCVAPVFATQGTTQWIGVHWLSRKSTNDCIRFTPDIVAELSRDDFESLPALQGLTSAM